MSLPKTIIIDGNTIETLNDFYDQVEAKFTKDLGWPIGRNEMAFNDVMRGGFGVHSYGEKVCISWKNATKSKQVLGLQDTVKRLTEIMNSDVHPFKNEKTQAILENAKKGIGTSMFEIILDIIKDNGHTLKLE